MEIFLSGMATLAFTANGAFFFRFWKKTDDKLFFYFAIAFWMLAAERVVLFMPAEHAEISPYVYLVRLIAFLIILFAIIQRNRKGRT